MKKYGNEFKVGLFVLASIGVLIFITFRTGKVDIKKPGYFLYATFDEIAGLTKKAPVMLNGLEVGKVDDIIVSYDSDNTKITLKLWLPVQAKVREGAVISIKTLGLMGEKYIQIASHGGSFMKPESTVTGKPYMDLDALMEETEALTGEAKKLSASLNYTVTSNQDKVSSIIKNLESTSQNVEELTADLKNNPWKLLSKPKGR
ncbi:MAG: MlaD family protein [Candidatus Omnitrophica bacterium]|jgi:phospholipid/cholesterol/gamma-HCH transport system substrate-binding protein|nr:MlaD family protein [Candidatus Omnitrophota bacterium]